jgi:hypothetical protein
LGSQTKNCATGNSWYIKPTTIVVTHCCAMKGRRRKVRKKKQGGGWWEQETCKHEGCARWVVRRGACITHGMSTYQDFGLLDKQLLRRQLLENKAAPDDDYSDDDVDDASPREKEKKVIAQKEEHREGEGRWEKKLVSTRDAPNGRCG